MAKNLIIIFKLSQIINAMWHVNLRGNATWYLTCHVIKVSNMPHHQTFRVKGWMNKNNNYTNVNDQTVLFKRKVIHLKNLI